MRKSKFSYITVITITIIVLNSGCFNDHMRSEFQSRFSADIQRTWIGPQYWANPLQDWQLNNGRIECFVSGGYRGDDGSEAEKE